MNIDPETAVNALLKQGVMLKAGPDTLFKTSKNHCVILLNANPSNDDYLVFVSASSQYTKRIEYANKVGLPNNTIVMIRPKTYFHLPKYTAVDCNYVHTLTKGVLISLYSEERINFYKTNPHISLQHLHQIINGVKSSPLILDEIKNLLS